MLACVILFKIGPIPDGLFFRFYQDILTGPYTTNHSCVPTQAACVFVYVRGVSVSRHVVCIRVLVLVPYVWLWVWRFTRPLPLPRFFCKSPVFNSSMFCLHSLSIAQPFLSVRACFCGLAFICVECAYCSCSLVLLRPPRPSFLNFPVFPLKCCKHCHQYVQR